MELEPFLGQIGIFAGNFAPRNWALCNGQLMSISANQALFTILGTTYGGNGVTTFALPDLRGRVAVSAGQRPGLSEITLGEVYGTETNTMTSAQMPAHTHTAITTPPNVRIAVNSGDEQDSDSPEGCFLRQTPGVDSYAGTANSAMGSSNATLNVTAAGGSQPINNIQPTLALNYCIALNGIYPTRG
ncbi:phage tail protein [Flavobacterium magnum]|uniref:Phage tail protein n=1 Tax=Flavobacterium magnum TaxID=2162713 RepID=A0A2S0RED6_9FLAO|nr:tail fiber protein [Flavobacterium magnum]AWA29879.1 phage tail protein [Flavobacterium magnum]